MPKTNVTLFSKSFDNVKLQFEFLRFCLSKDGLPRSRKRNFYELHKDAEITETDRKIAALKKHDPAMSDIYDDYWKRKKKELGKNFGKSNDYFRDQFIKDDLNRSEILLLFAHFERFMQDLHEDVLRADPRNLALIHENRKGGIKFTTEPEKFVDSAIFKNLKQFIESRILSQANELNRKGIHVRAEYFEKLGMRWSSEADISTMREISDLRNRISHESAHEQVSQQILEKARKLLKEIPRQCYAAAIKLYPDYFKGP